MDNEWLDIACINHEKYIVHGQLRLDGCDRTIEQTLTPKQKWEVDDLIWKQERQMRELLRSFINA